MNISLHWPQIMWLVITFLGLGVDLANDGKEKTRKESFTRSLIASAIVLTILWFGGFFSQP